MQTLLLTIHIIVALVLVLIVLIQAGRSGGLSGLMGGGGGDSLFSTASQQSGLRKATVIVAIVFMFTSIGLTILSSRGANRSVFNRAVPQMPAVPQQSAPAPADAGQ